MVNPSRTSTDHQQASSSPHGRDVMKQGPELHHSTTPILHHSTTPELHPSITPVLPSSSPSLHIVLLLLAILLTALSAFAGQGGVELSSPPNKQLDGAPGHIVTA